MYSQSKEMCAYMLPSHVLFLLVFSGILLSIDGTFGFEEDVELIDLTVVPQQSGALATVGNSKKGSTELDLGSCSFQTKVPCIQSGTCEDIPLLEPLRCRRRYCPQSKVYCLDFDGCMIPDPVFIYSLAAKEKKCPIPLSLCANKDQCQYVLRKNYDDLREPSLNRLNCSLMTKQIVFNDSTCKVHNDCHWTAKCCADGGFNRQCVSYNRTILPAKILSAVNNSCPNCNTSLSTTISSSSSTSSTVQLQSSASPTNGTISTASTIFSTVQLQSSASPTNGTISTASTIFSTVQLQSSASPTNGTISMAPTFPAVQLQSSASTPNGVTGMATGTFSTGKHQPPSSPPNGTISIPPMNPTSLPVQTNVTKSITIRIMNNYSSVVEGNESKFESLMINQLASILAIPTDAFTRMVALNGSILLEIEMTPSNNTNATEINRAYTQLVSMLRNGSLALTDLNGTQLNIPPQTNGDTSGSETKTYTTIIISVTAASLGTTLLLVLWILWNNKNNKAIIPAAAHLDRMNSHNMFRSKLSVDNLIDNNREAPNDHFSTFADPQVQWEIFQKSFNKPGYVWQSQDEAVWAGVDHQVQWPRLDAPDDESVPISSYRMKTKKGNTDM